MKHFAVTLIAPSFLAACTETPPPAPSKLRVIPSSPMSATKAFAEMTPEAAEPIYRQILGPDVRLNEKGETVVTVNTTDTDAIPTIRKAGSVMCQSAHLRLVDMMVFPRQKNGITQVQYCCK